MTVRREPGALQHRPCLHSGCGRTRVPPPPCAASRSESQIGARQTRAVEIDRIETPGDQRPVRIGHRRLDLAKMRDHFGDVLRKPSMAARHPAPCAENNRHRDCRHISPSAAWPCPSTKPGTITFPANRSSTMVELIVSRSSGPPTPRMGPSRTATCVASGRLAFIVTMRAALVILISPISIEGAPGDSGSEQEQVCSSGMFLWRAGSGNPVRVCRIFDNFRSSRAQV